MKLSLLEWTVLCFGLPIVVYATQCQTIDLIVTFTPLAMNINVKQCSKDSKYDLTQMFQGAPLNNTQIAAIGKSNSCKKLYTTMQGLAAKGPNCTIHGQPLTSLANLSFDQGLRLLGSINNSSNQSNSTRNGTVSDSCRKATNDTITSAPTPESTTLPPLATTTPTTTSVTPRVTTTSPTTEPPAASSSAISTGFSPIGLMAMILQFSLSR